jgi:hypothetical protein
MVMEEDGNHLWSAIHHPCHGEVGHKRWIFHHRLPIFIVHEKGMSVFVVAQIGKTKGWENKGQALVLPMAVFPISP